MANIDPQIVDADGLTPVFAAAAAAGDQLAAGDGVVAYFKNPTAAAISLTLVTPGTQAGLAIADRVIAVPAGGEVIVSLYPKLYTTGPGKRAAVTYTAAGLTVALLKAS